jgi:hypothetical protein
MIGEISSPASENYSLSPLEQKAKCKIGELGWESIKRSINKEPRSQNKWIEGKTISPNLIFEPGKFSAPFIMFYSIYIVYSLIYLIKIGSNASLNMHDKRLYALGSIIILARFFVEKLAEKLATPWIRIFLCAASDTLFLLSTSYIEYILGDLSVLASLVLMTIIFKLIIFEAPVRAIAMSIVFLTNAWSSTECFSVLQLVFITTTLWIMLVFRSLEKIKRRYVIYVEKCF